MISPLGKLKKSDEIDINYAFIRHGYGCHNATSYMYSQGHIDEKLFSEIRSKNVDNIYKDPELTETGVFASIQNGITVKDAIAKHNILSINKFNIVGCSPLIRSMETAYFMTRRWHNPPKKIYVFPLLREIDESSDNKYSEKSIRKLETISAYAMKSIDEQKRYLKSIGILEYFDFRYVEKYEELRKEPGDINKFVNWFTKNIVLNLINSKDLEDKLDNLNMFIITHAGVLNDYTKQRFYNNSGFLLQTKLLPEKNNELKFGKAFLLDQYIDPNKFLNPSNTSAIKEYDYNCPSNRCSYFCGTNSGKNNSKKRKKLPKLTINTKITKNFDNDKSKIDDKNIELVSKFSKINIKN
jgi:broad specificity phosphatase PhoE